MVSGLEVYPARSETKCRPSHVYYEHDAKCSTDKLCLVMFTSFEVRLYIRLSTLHLDRTGPTPSCNAENQQCEESINDHEEEWEGNLHAFIFC